MKPDVIEPLLEATKFKVVNYTATDGQKSFFLSSHNFEVGSVTGLEIESVTSSLILRLSEQRTAVIAACGDNAGN